ncbi:MAG: hypothetical protein J1F64_10180, partial [Oscillospiraceae bacterium]|nr:hypothetical protein [Oscillospiraceae bacterium]
MIELKWLSEKKDHTVFGIPHKRGEVKKEDSFVIKTDFEKIPTQTFCAAYWNDGSVKWTVHSVSDIPNSNFYALEKGSAEVKNPIIITENENEYHIDTGAIKAVIGRNGADIIKSITDNNGNTRCTGGRLVLLNENRFKNAGYQSTIIEPFKSIITSSEITKGDIKTVVRLQGCHSGQNIHMRNGRERRFIPFDLRLYFFSASDEIKIKHTFIFDGQQNTDFIKGIGIEFDVAVSGENYNKHVRFTGESGVFCDSPKNLLTWRTTGKYHDMYEKQTGGERIEFDKAEDERFLGLLDESAVWDDFKITQLSANEYGIYKRTGEGCVYICGNYGKRSLGTGCISDEAGAFSLYLKDFWQKYPSAVEFKGVSGNDAKAVVWLWSPDANAMDLRHYDTRCHVHSAYEGFDELRATPYGIANTNEITLKVEGNVPSNDEFLSRSKKSCEDCIFIAKDPSYY